MSSFSNVFVAAIVATGAALISLPANAAVISLGYQRGQDAGITTFGTGSGAVAETTKVGAFSITANAQGEPILTSPNLFSNAISVRNVGDNAASNTLSVFVTETGVTKATPFFMLNFVDSSLSTLPLTESVYVSESNTAYALTNLIASSTVKIGDNKLQQFATPAGLTSPYSITFVYSMMFPGGDSIVNANLNEVGVPEPMSLALLGAGLAGLGFVRGRPRKSA